MNWTVADLVSGLKVLGYTVNDMTPIGRHGVSEEFFVVSTEKYALTLRFKLYNLSTWMMLTEGETLLSNGTLEAAMKRITKELGDPP